MRKRRVAGIPGPVNRRTRGQRFTSFVLHDVQLTTLRPWCGRKLSAEHPECGPQPLPVRQFDTRFDSTGRSEHGAARRDLGRGVRARPVVTRESRGSARRDHQLTVAVQRHVVSGRRVALLLAVAPAAVAHRAAVSGLVAPLGAVHARAGGAGELVAPCERPPWRRHASGRRSAGACARTEQRACNEQAGQRLTHADDSLV